MYVEYRSPKVYPTPKLVKKGYYTAVIRRAQVGFELDFRPCIDLVAMVEPPYHHRNISPEYRPECFPNPSPGEEIGVVAWLDTVNLNGGAAVKLVSFSLVDDQVGGVA